jgi:hypothetical protein
MAEEAIAELRAPQPNASKLRAFVAGTEVRSASFLT